jgi:redox-sensitive bicupin YhaK (pirin superfamily)
MVGSRPHLFSFADYYDPENMNFGNLRVFNDDTVLGKQGFGTHSHQDMEIVTILLQGTLSHQDSMGNTEHIRVGEVQRMSAGTGVQHSEFNESEETVHLYQIWIQPSERGLPPEYEQMKVPRKDNEVVPLVSNTGISGALNVHADVKISSLFLEKGKEVSFSLPEEKGLFVYLTSGKLRLNGEMLHQHDQARVAGVGNIQLVADETSEMILIEVAL